MAIQWMADLPKPEAPAEPWVNVGNFDTKREAVDFLMREYNLSRATALSFVSRIEV